MLKRKVASLAASGVAAGLLVFGSTAALAAGPTLTAPTQPKVFHYVALGDSLTSGYEPGKGSDFVPYGFVDRLYEQALTQGRADLHNYGVLGLTSKGLVTLLQDVSAGKSIAAGTDLQANLSQTDVRSVSGNVNQIKSDLKAADLITITIGGNDFKPLLSSAAGQSDADMQTAVSDMVYNYSNNLASSLGMLYQLNPSAQVVVANQYQPLPQAANPTLYAKLEAVKDIFTQAVNSVVQTLQKNNMQVKMTDIATPFIGKEAQDTYIKLPDIHPNQQGYDLIARAFATAIWGSYTAPQPNDPISIIAMGRSMNKLPLQPILMDDRTYVPVREYAEMLGANVGWDNDTQTASISYNGLTIQFQIESKVATVLGQTVPLTNAAHLINDHTYVPLRAFAAVLGLDVQYIGQDNTVYVNQ